MTYARLPGSIKSVIDAVQFQPFWNGMGKYLD